jgi:hypothetical protein
MYLFPNARESTCKLDDMLVLGTFSDFTEAGMVTVLLSALGIATGRLDVAVRSRRPPMGASALMRLRTAASDSLEPSARM